jgi:hypothetical protein
MTVLTDSLGRKIDFKNNNYHDFECWSKTIKDFGQGVGFGTAARMLMIILKVLLKMR